MLRFFSETVIFLSTRLTYAFCIQYCNMQIRSLCFYCSVSRIIIVLRISFIDHQITICQELLQIRSVGKLGCLHVVLIHCLVGLQITGSATVFWAQEGVEDDWSIRWGWVVWGLKCSDTGLLKQIQNLVIIGTLHGPYASFLIGQVSYHKNGTSGWLMQWLKKGHQLWMSVAGAAMWSIYE